jgi:hypothetical protein
MLRKATSFSGQKSMHRKQKSEGSATPLSLKLIYAQIQDRSLEKLPFSIIVNRSISHVRRWHKSCCEDFKTELSTAEQ